MSDPEKGRCSYKLLNGKYCGQIAAGDGFCRVHSPKYMRRRIMEIAAQIEALKLVKRQTAKRLKAIGKENNK